jgi:hypothetical protein
MRDAMEPVQTMEFLTQVPTDGKKHILCCRDVLLSILGFFFVRDVSFHALTFPSTLPETVVQSKTAKYPQFEIPS